MLDITPTIEYAPDTEHISMPIADWRRRIAAAYYAAAIAGYDEGVKAFYRRACVLADGLVGDFPADGNITAAKHFARYVIDSTLGDYNRRLEAHSVWER